MFITNKSYVRCLRSYSIGFQVLAFIWSRFWILNGMLVANVKEYCSCTFKKK